MKNASFNLVYYSLSVLTFILISCGGGSEADRDLDKQILDEQFSKIEMLAYQPKCTDSTEWKSIAYGAKACGGPQGYLPYYLKGDTTLLKKLVRDYTLDEKAFNEKYDITSDCSIPPAPEGVRCENERAVLVY